MSLQVESLPNPEDVRRPSFNVHELVHAEEDSDVALPGERIELVGWGGGSVKALFGLDEIVFGGGRFDTGNQTTSQPLSCDSCVSALPFCSRMETGRALT